MFEPPICTHKGDMLNKAKIRELLEARFANETILSLRDLPSPSLFKDIALGAKRVKKALRNRELITIVGDYDVDGVSASVIMSEFLEAHGANLELIIPHRQKDGYGLSEGIVRRAKGSLIITVDNGIGAIEAARVAKELGKELIITDHHLPSQTLPEALAIINPHQKGCMFPYKNICGAVVAWYFCAAIKEEFGSDFRLDLFLELLGIATIADVMPLKGINRVIARAAIKRINSSNKSAFKLFLSRIGRQIGFEELSFRLIPLLNSAGRMDDAMSAYRFLSAKNIEAASRELDILTALNERRREEEGRILRESSEFVEDSLPCIVAYKEGWHEGVIGIVASRLAKEFNKPTILFSLDGERAKGSARGVEGVDIFSKISEHKELLLGFGGHKGAAGLSIEKRNLERFTNAFINSFIQDYRDNTKFDGFLDPNEIDDELLDILEEFQPYGEENPKLRFRSDNLYVKNVKRVGKEGRSFMFEIECEKSTLKGFKFFAKEEEMREGSTINCIYEIEASNYRNKREPKILISKIIS